MQATPEPAPALRRVTALALALGLAAMMLGLAQGGTPGWDEAGHALSALRLAESLRALDAKGFVQELLRPSQYPPLGRLGMALGFLAVGPHWSAPRAASAVAWILAVGAATRFARRMVPAERGDAAAAWTAFLGLTCWLGGLVGRAALLEPWSTLATVAGALAYLRAREGGRGAALVLGLALLAALLVKYSYGPQLLVAVALATLVDRRLGEREGGARWPWPWALAPLLAGLAWWFVLPLPGGLAIGAGHRAYLALWFRQGAQLDSLGPEFLAVVWPLQCSLSLPAFALQLAGLAWGAAAWRRPAPRLALLLVAVGVGCFVLFPFRVDRFLLPTLFGAWALGGALTAQLGARLAPRARVPAGLALLALLVASAGLGGTALVAATQRGTWDADARRAVTETLRAWRRPLAPAPLPASAPAGVEALLDLAVAHLDPAEPFGWIGGTAAELPYPLVQWRLFQRTGDRRALAHEWPAEDYFWEPPGWDEAGFRAWAARFPRVVTVDPPDLRGRGARAFEAGLVAWMATHPGFAVEARGRVGLGTGREHTVTVYGRAP